MLKFLCPKMCVVLLPAPCTSWNSMKMFAWNLLFRPRAWIFECKKCKLNVWLAMLPSIDVNIGKVLYRRHSWLFFSSTEPFLNVVITCSSWRNNVSVHMSNPALTACFHCVADEQNFIHVENSFLNFHTILLWTCCCERGNKWINIASVPKTEQKKNRNISRKSLNKTMKKAFINASTGERWTQQENIAESPRDLTNPWNAGSGCL